MRTKLFLLLFCITTVSFAQKKEKIKGNKFVKVKQYDLKPFKSLTVTENLDIVLLKGDEPKIEVETDESLHDVIKFDVINGDLKIYTSHKIVSKKKLNIRVTFDDKLEIINAKEKSVVSSLIDLNMKTLSVSAEGGAKLYLTLKCDKFDLKANQRTKIELNLNAVNTSIELSEASDIKALINSETLKIDLYQKANAQIEGEVNSMDLRADNASNFKGQRLTANSCNLIAEGSSDCHVEVRDILTIEASGSSEIHIYNTPKINVEKFIDSAVVYKK